ncbi:MAG TPA: 5-formyltetrahydrofolate cyclo-ligase [Rickettsiales bacterium]|nr:5-formyltetrahydrofolate cyclo-ligase [Rickettsiales bacterium]
MNSILKAAIRKEKLAQRQAMAPHLHEALSQRIAERLEPYLDGGIIGAYSPVRGEVDISHIIRRSNASLPLMTPDSLAMTFHRCHHGLELKKNRYGILEPSQDMEECEPDILIVPVVAFDRQGYRIGYGGGYYDVTLKHLRDLKPIQAIGVAFASQEVTNVPHEIFDAKLDRVITEKETLEFI